MNHKDAPPEGASNNKNNNSAPQQNPLLAHMQNATPLRSRASNHHHHHEQVNATAKTSYYHVRDVNQKTILAQLEGALEEERHAANALLEDVPRLIALCLQIILSDAVLLAIPNAVDHFSSPSPPPPSSSPPCSFPSFPSSPTPSASFLAPPPPPLPPPASAFASSSLSSPSPSPPPSPFSSPSVSSPPHSHCDASPPSPISTQITQTQEGGGGGEEDDGGSEEEAEDRDKTSSSRNQHEQHSNNLQQQQNNDIQTASTTIKPKRSFLRHLFNVDTESLLLQHLLDLSDRSPYTPLKDVVKSIISRCMSDWLFVSSSSSNQTAAKDDNNVAAAEELVSVAIDRHYEQYSAEASIFAHPKNRTEKVFWKALLLSTCLSLYCAMKDAFLQIVHNYIEHGRVGLLRFVNLKYYLRLCTSVFYTVLLGQTKLGELPSFLHFILEQEFGGLRCHLLPSPCPSTGCQERLINEAEIETSFISTPLLHQYRHLKKEENVFVVPHSEVTMNNENAEEESNSMMIGWCLDFEQRRTEDNQEKYRDYKSLASLQLKQDTSASTTLLNISNQKEDEAAEKEEAEEAQTKQVKGEEEESDQRDQEEPIVQPPPQRQTKDKKWLDTPRSFFHLADLIRGQQRDAEWGRYYQELSSSSEFPQNVVKKNKYMKMMIRKHGILPELRGKFWQAFVQSHSHRQHFSYATIAQACSNQESQHTIQIDKDLQRTFPNNERFQSKGDGIESMRRVLVSYASVNPDIGYCQSMNFITAMLLLFMDEEEAFFMLMTIVESTMPKHYYTPCMRGLITDAQMFLKVLNLKVPRVAAHLRSLGIDVKPVIYHWLLCLFVGVFPVEVVLRVWDAFFYEGNHILFRFCLGLLKLEEETILQAEDEADAFMVMKDLPKRVEKDALIRMTFSKSFSGLKKLVYKKRKEANAELCDKSSSTPEESVRFYPHSTSEIVTRHQLQRHNKKEVPSSPSSEPSLDSYQHHSLSPRSVKGGFNSLLPSFLGGGNNNSVRPPSPSPPSSSSPSASASASASSFEDNNLQSRTFVSQSASDIETRHHHAATTSSSYRKASLGGVSSSISRKKAIWNLFSGGGDTSAPSPSTSSSSINRNERRHQKHKPPFEIQSERLDQTSSKVANHRRPSLPSPSHMVLLSPQSAPSSPASFIPSSPLSHPSSPSSSPFPQFNISSPDSLPTTAEWSSASASHNYRPNAVRFSPTLLPPPPHQHHKRTRSRDETQRHHIRQHRHHRITAATNQEMEEVVFSQLDPTYSKQRYRLSFVIRAYNPGQPHLLLEDYEQHQQQHEKETKNEAETQKEVTAQTDEEQETAVSCSAAT